MEIIDGLEFYAEGIKGPIKVLRSMAKFNEIFVQYFIDGKEHREFWKLTKVIDGFKNKLYRMNSIPGMSAIINEPSEIIIVRMALPGLRERIQNNVDLITVVTPDGNILLEAYNRYIETIDSLTKRLNA